MTVIIKKNDFDNELLDGFRQDLRYLSKFYTNDIGLIEAF